MRRSEEEEILDGGDLSPETIAKAYRQLSQVNRWLGNTDAVLRLLGPDQEHDHDQNRKRPRRVLDIGCGHGALLVTIRKNLGAEVVGIDLRPAPADAPVPILTGNAVSDPLPEADVAICVMLAHHLSEAELAEMVRNVGRSCRRFVMLDLVRHPVPLALFRAFVGPLLCRLNAQDGATSIRRAYTPGEMRRVVDGALSGLQRPVSRMKHTVAPFWIRQVVDICWEPSA